ncbi:MAG: rRNA maturation RNase YbeY [Treponema sp.]|jgi:probable rRNA maturation factor|nr:rRNA maturation RNase YbeY [Treponema sp.]
MANRILISLGEDVTEPVWFNKVEPFIQTVLQKLNYDNEEISVLFCSDEFIKELNSQYRNIDSATDVLSFENGEEYEDEEGLWKNVGDIAISLETLPKNAEYFEVDTNTELKRLIIHGILHLNGMDHGEEHIEKGVVPTDEMLILQENLLADLSDEKIIG